METEVDQELIEIMACSLRYLKRMGMFGDSDAMQLAEAVEKQIKRFAS